MTDRHNTRSGYVCPTCHKKIKRTDSYAQPAPGREARAVRVRGYDPWPQTRIPCGV